MGGLALVGGLEAGSTHSVVVLAALAASWATRFST